MTRLLPKVPWFLSAAAIVAAAVALAIGANVLLSPYFERSFLDEADPLASSSGMSDGSQPPAAETPAASGPPAAAAGAPGVLLQGEWRDGEPGHNGEGIAKILRTADGRLVLRVEDISVTNGPDLFVVLSPDDDGYAGGSLNLGALKATDGNFNYDIPAGTDLSLYKSAVVWCRSFDVTFAVATLEEV